MDTLSMKNSNEYQIIPIQYWLVLIASFVLLFAPAYYELSQTIWQTEAQSQGPLVIIICLFLLFQQRSQFVKYEPKRGDVFFGIIGFVIASTIYVLSAMVSLVTAEVLAHITFLISVVLIIGGSRLLGKIWFPVFFLIFLIPLPGFVVDAATLPMKIFVSNLAESILYSLGYPIARDGVIIQIGFYKLLVADACAGLHTLISLEAIGLLYLYLIKSKSIIRNTALAILIIPISLFANTVRVITLVLITFYYGDELGQSFIHDFSSFVLFFVALLSIILVDVLLRKASNLFSKQKEVDL